LVTHRTVVGGTSVAAVFLGILIYSLGSLHFEGPVEEMIANNHLSDLGVALFADYAAPFEVAGLLLLVSLVAAAVIATQFIATKKS